MTIIYLDTNDRRRTATGCKPHTIPNFWAGTRDDGKVVRFHRDQIVRVCGKGEK